MARNVFPFLRDKSAPSLRCLWRATVWVRFCLEHSTGITFALSLPAEEGKHPFGSVHYKSYSLQNPCRTKQKCSEMARILPLWLNVESCSGEALPPPDVPSGPTCALR